MGARTVGSTTLCTTRAQAWYRGVVCVVVATALWWLWVRMLGLNDGPALAGLFLRVAMATSMGLMWGCLPPAYQLRILVILTGLVAVRNSQHWLLAAAPQLC